MVAIDPENVFSGTPGWVRWAPVPVHGGGTPNHTSDFRDPVFMAHSADITTPSVLRVFQKLADLPSETLDRGEADSIHPENLRRSHRQGNARWHPNALTNLDLQPPSDVGIQEPETLDQLDLVDGPINWFGSKGHAESARERCPKTMAQVRRIRRSESDIGVAASA